MGCNPHQHVVAGGILNFENGSELTMHLGCLLHPDSGAAIRAIAKSAPVRVLGMFTLCTPRRIGRFPCDTHWCSIDILRCVVHATGARSRGPWNCGNGSGPRGLVHYLDHAFSLLDRNIIGCRGLFRGPFVRYVTVLLPPLEIRVEPPSLPLLLPLVELLFSLFSRRPIIFLDREHCFYRICDHTTCGL